MDSRNLFDGDLRGEDEEHQAGDSAVERGLLHPRVRPASFKRDMGSRKQFIWVIKAFWLRNSPPLCFRALGVREHYLGEEVTAVISVPAYL